MNRIQVVALMLSLLLHAGGGLFLYRSGLLTHQVAEDARIHAKTTGSFRLLDPSEIPRETPEKQLVPKPRDNPPDKYAVTDESVKALSESTEQSSVDSLRTEGFSENLPPGGVYPEPVYPDRARKEEREGFVVVKFDVDGSGNISAITLTASEGGSDFARSVIKALKSWEFPEGFPGTYKRQFLFRLK